MFGIQGTKHWKVVKKILCYLQGTKDYMLTYIRTNNLEIIGNSDGCKDARRSISGNVFMLSYGHIF